MSRSASLICCCFLEFLCCLRLSFFTSDKIQGFADSLVDLQADTQTGDQWGGSVVYHPLAVGYSDAGV